MILAHGSGIAAMHGAWCRGEAGKVSTLRLSRRMSQQRAAMSSPPALGVESLAEEIGEGDGGIEGRRPAKGCEHKEGADEQVCIHPFDVDLADFCVGWQAFRLKKRYR